MTDDHDALSYEAWADPEPPFEEGDDYLPAPVDDVLPGETIDERNARIRRRNQETRERERPEGTEYDPYPSKPVPVSARGAQMGVRRGKALRQRPTSPSSGLGNDREAIHRFFVDRAQATPFALVALLGPAHPGRPSDAERQRRDELAKIVAAARDAGAKVEAIADVTSRPLAVVADLARRGRELNAG